MTYTANIMKLVEDALSECYTYHDDLDQFLIRSGINEERIKFIRNEVEEKNRFSNYERAPKRKIVQKLLKDCQTESGGNERVSEIIIELTCGSFPDATKVAKSAIKALQKQTNNAEHEFSIRNTKKQSEKRRELKKEFSNLYRMSDVHKRGYAFEKFLNQFFKNEGLEPKCSYKIEGEQIDGSFSWANKTYLFEARWRNKKSDSGELGSFIFKLNGKTVDTRGLFISINGYTNEALPALKSKGELKLVCIDATHLKLSLSKDIPFKTILQRIWRHADETGEPYLEKNQVHDLLLDFNFASYKV